MNAEDRDAVSVMALAQPPIGAALSPFSRCAIFGERVMSQFYGELVARWLGARGVYLDVMFFQDEPHLKRVRFTPLKATWFFDSFAASVESITPLAAAVSQAGGRLLVSCEADWWCPPPWYGPGDPVGISRVASLLSEADIIVVPSRRLAEVVGARFHRPVVVIPPSLPPLADWPHAGPRRPNGVRVGWVGSATHLGDLEMIGPAVLELLARRADVTYVHAGPLVPPWARSHPRIERHVVAMATLPNYYRWLAALQFDIFLCPILAHPWNEAKPCLKPLEAAGVGIPVIASRVGSYAEDLRHEETALLVENTTEAWLGALTRVVEDAALRAHLASRGLAWAATRTIEATGPLWAKLWGAA